MQRMRNTTGLASEARRPIVPEIIDGIAEFARFHTLLGHEFTRLAVLALGDTIRFLVLTRRTLDAMPS